MSRSDPAPAYCERVQVGEPMPAQSCLTHYRADGFGVGARCHLGEDAAVLGVQVNLEATTLDLTTLPSLMTAAAVSSQEVSMARMVVMAQHCSTEIVGRGCIMGAGGTPKLRRCAMYKSFRVKNFRCFKDLQINDLGRVNLIARITRARRRCLRRCIFTREIETLRRSCATTLPEASLRYSERFMPARCRSDELYQLGNYIPYILTQARHIDLYCRIISVEPSLFDEPYESSVKLEIVH